MCITYQFFQIAKAMIKTGKLLSRGHVIKTDERPTNEIRMLKVTHFIAYFNYTAHFNFKTDRCSIIILQFGELQVELSPRKAYIGAAIGFVFG